MKKHIPNTLTLLNLLCGGVGVVNILEGRGTAAYFVWVCCVFDFFDGSAARWLKAPSAIGKELDSLADVVSFGVLPAIFMYLQIAQRNSPDGLAYLPYVALLILAFSALRLAIFNIDEEQTDSFKGLSTPANAIFITGLAFLPQWAWLSNPYVYVAIAVVMSALLVAPIRLMAFKFKNFTWALVKWKVTFLLIAISTLSFLGCAGISFLVLPYIVVSMFEKKIAVNAHRKT